MPVVIIHGDDKSQSLAKVSEMKKSYAPEGIEQLSLKETSFDQLLIRLATPSFFSEQRLFIIDDADEKKIDLEKLDVDSTQTLVLLFSKELTQSSTIMKIAVAKKYRLISLSQPQDKRIFSFLDLLAEKNTKALALLDELLHDFGAVYILTMLIYLLRRLALPIGSAPSFVADKLQKQKKNFSEQKIIDLYKQTLETDFAIKTGKAEEKTALFILIHTFLQK